MSKNVRVRFAPSPTGPLHIGGVRTALFNYLFAKKYNGTFVLRIEDTDQNRYVEGAEDYIVESFNWCGIPFDEGPGRNEKFGPYRQSERKQLYKQYADQLVKSGRAYYAFDTTEELTEYRTESEARGETFIYNLSNRKRFKNSLSLSEEETNSRISNGDDYVIRFKMLDPKTQGSQGSITTRDLIRGTQSFRLELLDDKILFKSDGMPTYHLANIVDDYLMKITHVIRGEEWLPSLPLHISLYQALGWQDEMPEFAHLPLILKPTGKGKLSKRDGDKLGFPVFPLEWKDPKSGEISRGYKEDGYFPEAMVNFLAFLGWNPGTEQEIFSLNELINAFDLERVHKSGARFDPEKIKWFNHHYMQNYDNDELAMEFKASRPELASIDVNYISMVVGLVKERATFISDFWELSSFFFEAPKSYVEKSAKKAWKDDTDSIMKELVSVINNIEVASAENLQTEIKEWITKKGIGFGKVMQPLRLALVGDLKGPDLFQIMFLIGRDAAVRRIELAIAQIN
ncbi:glutamate--tRNA ligase [Flavobacteriaceae bacterium S0825]|uniref:glutamate--tRNA ligase n=1 Tax=Gaetbulibacter sp. S0825 TaxID=2720084 RepID=UPI001431D277|nr:glutamate--tRNA ligase [Gaetbulibacter sp. S0825]MCK0108258.1 glutamate--tRNA ligase [Flavobacteriaceae bacterium S0825]NIX63894.1 glutamate--tRNA ligase [Gaetbulibacter sp. S0825]